MNEFHDGFLHRKNWKWQCWWQSWNIFLAKYLDEKTKYIYKVWFEYSPLLNQNLNIKSDFSFSLSVYVLLSFTKNKKAEEYNEKNVAKQIEK